MNIKQTAIVVAALLIASASASAQDVDDNVPIPAVTGTIGLDGTVDKFYGVTHSAIVKTADGVRHLVHLTSHTAVHGARSADDAFGGLQQGSRVVVHYVMDGDEKTAIEIDRVGDDGLTLLEGTVKHVDRNGKTLTLQLADDSIVTLRLTDRAARDVGKDIEGAGRVVVYYAEDGGERVAHYFRKVN
jgi:hypothetical protein